MSNKNIFDELLAVGARKKKQCIWIIRYGTTKYPIMEEFDTDLDPNEGTEHARCIAQRLFEDPNDAPTVIYTSPFVRCAHTAQLIALATPPPPPTAAAVCSSLITAKATNGSSITTATTSTIINRPAVRVEPGLTEWLTPDLLLLKTMHEHHQHVPRSAEELAETYGTIDLSHASLVNPFVGASVQHDNNNNNDNNDGQIHLPPFETEQEFLQRCAMTMTKLLELHDIDATNMAIVSHAPCNQAMTLHLLQQQESNTICNNEPISSSSPVIQLQPWPLGGITKFTRIIDNQNGSGDVSRKTQRPWTMEFYADTQHLPGKYKKGFKGWSLPCFQQQQPQQQPQQQLQQHPEQQESLADHGVDHSPSTTTTTTTTTTPQSDHSLKATSSLL